RARDAHRAVAVVQAHPAVATARAPDGTTILQQALYHRLAPVADALIAAGAPVDVHEAAILGDAARVRHLAAADPSLVHARAADGGTPLHYAAHFGHAEVARELLKRGADARAMAGPPFSNTPLHAACAGRQGALVALLLDAGAQPDVPDARGHRPLHVAAAGGDVACVGALLAAGADRFAKGPDGKAPLDHAKERGHAEVVAMLG
ncbi:MAG TPA: ankyrin repeat domain-containing protein, partial [Candidatus Thermoplasmatota archaeon]|nr:ankyrin repeat domain-containing protein [Candidatus Thermoplasmatota archaeon]